jgi:hemolysin-activating ACP:hemolysin acyltransferase
MFWRKKSSESEGPAVVQQAATPEPAPAQTEREPAPAPVPQPEAPRQTAIAPQMPAANPVPMAAAQPASAQVVPLPKSDKAKQISASFGEIVAVLLRSPAHRKLPLAYLESLAVPAVITGQFALAEARSAAHGYQAPVAVVVWASVSTEIDRRLAQDPTQLNKLNQADWKSGDVIWIVDAVGQKEAVKGLIDHLRKDRFAGKQVRYREVTETKEVVAKIMPS